MPSLKVLLPSLLLLALLGGCTDKPAQEKPLSFDDLPISNATPWPECGVKASEAFPDENKVLTLVNASVQKDEEGIVITKSGVLPVSIKNNLDSSLSIGSSGYVGVYLSDAEGIIVATPGGMPEPWMEFELGAKESENMSTTSLQSCSEKELTGDYQAWGQINLSVSSAEETRQLNLNGGPWEISF